MLGVLHPTRRKNEGKHLNRIVASVPTREYDFVSTDANARTGKSGEGSGEAAGSKVLGAYGRDVLNENGKLLLGFAEDNKLALLNTLFCTPKSGVSNTFQSAKRSKGQARLEYIVTTQAGRRLIRCVNAHRPPLKASESDHNLVYSIRKSASHAGPHQNRKKRDSTKETPKTDDLRRLMADPNLRCICMCVFVVIPFTLDVRRLVDAPARVTPGEGVA